MPRRVFAGTTPAWPAALSGSGYPAPCTMAIFSSSVICATRRRARWSPARRVFIQGRADPRADMAAGADDARGAAAAPGMVPRHATATTTPLTTLMALTFMAAPGRERPLNGIELAGGRGRSGPRVRQLRVSVARKDNA